MGSGINTIILDGKRIQESAKTTSKTLVIDVERRRRRELDQAAAGIPIEQRSDRIRSLGDMVREYLETYSVNHRTASLTFATGRLAHVSRLFGAKLLTDLSEREIRLYMKTRLGEGVSGRTVNAELRELSRAIGKPWKTLWQRARKMEERKDVGEALSREQESAILKTISTDQSPNRSRTLAAFVRMRC